MDGFKPTPAKSRTASPRRPTPPVVGKVTHHSIELYWEEAMDKENESLAEAAGTSRSGDNRVKVCLQEEDSHGDWGNLYTGYAKRHNVEGLEPWSQYRYRIRFMTDGGNSEWSPTVIVSTTKEPMTGEHLHKALILSDLPQFERILDSGDLHSVDVLDKYGHTPLMVASQKGLLDFIDALVDHDCDIDYQNESGKTAMMMAAYAGRLDSVKELRYHGASYNLKDKGGSTALHWAVDSKNPTLLGWMIDDGADVELKDCNGWTPLFRVAALTGDCECATLLLRQGASMNLRDTDGKTPLMMAVVNNHVDLVKILLESGADLTLKNEYGKGAHEMAVAMERRKIAKAIEEFMDRKGIHRHI